MRRVILSAMVTLSLAVSYAAADVPQGWYPLRISLPSLTGEIVTHDDIRTGPTALIFWNKSNFLSEAILADFKAYHDRFGDELKIYAVHSGEDVLEDVMSFAQNKKIPFPVLLDWNSRAQKRYRVTKLPAAVIFSSEGRSTFNLEGYYLSGRRELAANLHEVVGRDRKTGDLVAVRSRRDRERELPDNGAASLCRVPRSLYCQITAERGGAPSNPAVMAVRLSVCRGDMEHARNMIRGIGSNDYTRNDLRFALGNMMLLQGRTAEAEEVFSDLLERAPDEGWGAWGLGMSALAAGKASAAARHMRKAAAIDGGNAEAETAVLRFMEEHWEQNKAAPGEKDFLSLFAMLSSVRDCYRQISLGS